MAFVPLVLVQLSLLFFSCSADIHHPLAPAPAPHHYHYHHHHHPSSAPTLTPPVKPPAHSPAKPPVHPPAKSPTYPPHKAPTPLPPRKLVAVQGVVYCKPCEYVGISTTIDATPLQGAIVKLLCDNTKIGFSQNATTDIHGYFWILAKKLTTAAFHKCKVFLVNSPSKNCNVTTNMNFGTVGAMLIPDKKVAHKAETFQQFNVGPFAFDPVKKTCHY